MRPTILYALAVIALTPAAARAAACPAAGPASPGALHRDWILVGWEKRVGAPPFDFAQKLGRFYDWSSKDVVLYDDLSPQHRVAHSAAEYGAIWTPIFRAQRQVHHTVLDGPDVVASADLATSTLEFGARLEGPDGKISGIRDRSTLVWHCTDGGWRIVREHNSSYGVSPADLDRLTSRVDR